MLANLIHLQDEAFSDVLHAIKGVNMTKNVLSRKLKGQKF